MKKLGIILVLFLTLISINLVLADAPDCVFAGSASINSQAADANLVQGYYESDGELVGNATEVPLGYSLTIVDNKDSLITFKINGVDANEEGPHECSGGGLTVLDLTATVINFEGSKEDVTSNVENLEITVGESDDLSQGFFGEQEVEFKDGTDTLITFNYDFDSGSLNLSAIKINKQDENATLGSVEISGISLLEGQTKTVYLNRIANTSYVCVLDVKDASITETMTSDCSGAKS